MIRIDPDRWHYAGRARLVITSKLTRGTLVIAQRRPFRIDRIAELSTDKWPERYVTAWRDAGMPDTDTWWNRPVRVTGFWGEPDADTRAHATVAPASHGWEALPEHYMVCHLCRELPPCTHVHNEAIASRAEARFAEDMAILPSSCHGCREPITKRQKSFTFPGANLIRPDFGDNSAIFHTRGSCRDALTSYDKRWTAAEPDRTRWFFCEGTRVWHHDGSSECDRADCHAKGDMTRLVDHRCQIWHHPGDLDAAYGALNSFVPGVDTGQDHTGCWCLKGATA